jgi:prephenate dehydrogenase
MSSQFHEQLYRGGAVIERMRSARVVVCGAGALGGNIVESLARAGVADGYGEAIWNRSYRVPSAAQDDVCDYPLARNLAMIVASAACESLIRAISTGAKESYTLTLEDFAIRRFET